MNYDPDYKYVKHIPGWMNWYDLNIIAICSSLAPKSSVAVEIGAFCGRSSTVISKNIPATTKFHSIDLWEFSEEYKLDVGYYHSDLTEDDINLATDLARTSGSWKAVWDYYVPKRDNTFGLKLNSSNYIVQPNTMFAFVDGDHKKDSVFKDLSKFINLDNCLILGDDFTKKFINDVPVAAIAHHLEDKNRYLVSFPKSKIYALWPTVGYWANKLPGVIQEYNKILQT